MKKNKIFYSVWEMERALIGLDTMKIPVMKMKENGIGLMVIQLHLHSGETLNQTTTTVEISQKEKTVCASGMVLRGMTGGVTRQQPLCVRRLLRLLALPVMSLSHIIKDSMKLTQTLASE
jgi:hypothetical protein